MENESAITILHKFAAEQGWNEDTQLLLLARFIDTQQAQGALCDFLVEVQDEENDPEAGECSVCGEESNELESTYCGSICSACLQDHITECGICRPDWETHE